MATTDLTIRGAGVFGLSIAWEALRRGARVTVVDPHGPAAGASGGVVGALQPHTPTPWNAKKAFQLESLLRAKEFWAEVDATSGEDSGYSRAGRLLPLPDQRAIDLARSRADGAAQQWPGEVNWNVTQDVDPHWAAPSGSGWYVHDTLSALIHPRNATLSLAEAVRARGAGIAIEAPDHGPIVWATGWAGLTEMSALLGKAVGTGEKGQAALLDHDAVGQPQIYADGVHVIPHTNGTVGIGSTSEREFSNSSKPDSQLDDLIDRARALVPALSHAPVLERWAGVRPRAASRAPLLGPWPNKPGHFVANGGFKIGFGMAPRVAQVMCDLVLDGVDNVPEAFGFNALPA